VTRLAKKRASFLIIIYIDSSFFRTPDCHHHRISILAYAIEQQRWQLGVPKNEISLMSLAFKNDARSLASVSLCGTFSKICWHASKWSSISFSHWQCPSDGDFSFPRFVGLLILSLWSSLLFYSGNANSMVSLHSYNFTFWLQESFGYTTEVGWTIPSWSMPDVLSGLGVCTCGRQNHAGRRMAHSSMF
jgi:hypothetical protein